MRVLWRRATPPSVSVGRVPTVPQAMSSSTAAAITGRSCWEHPHGISPLLLCNHGVHVQENYSRFPRSNLTRGQGWRLYQSSLEPKMIETFILFLFCLFCFDFCCCFIQFLIWKLRHGCKKYLPQLSKLLRNIIVKLEDDFLQAI